MRITKWGEYGILCCVFLAKRHGAAPCGSDSIAQELEVPEQYAQQILQRLRRGGIIESVRGPKGGYRLRAEPTSISLRAIVEAAEGQTFEILCQQNTIFDSCSTSKHNACGLHDVWYGLKAVVDEYLQSFSLADIVARSARQHFNNVDGVVTIGRAKTETHSRSQYLSKSQ